MSISISSQVLGTLSVTIAETTGTLSVAVLSTAPAALSVELGTPGPAASVTVGTTTTLSPGSSATVTNSGNSMAAVLNFGIPKGADGADGSPGVGVPAGGVAGQSLLKVDGVDYNTTWGTPGLAYHAETTQATVRNSTGSTLMAGQIVYINGALGNRPTVALSKADAESTSAGTYAMVESAIPNNTDGTVITAGTVSGLDTSALADGDKLYLSPLTSGSWTTTKPSSPNHLVYIGTVTRAHPNQGTIQLRIQNGYELEELHNVAISSPTNLDLLAYESSTSLWKNKSFSTLGLETSAHAASTYYLATNPSNYITSSALTGYATQSWVISQGYLTSAPVTSVAGRTGAITLSNTDISGLGTMATASASSYSTTAVANTLYYPLTGNPSGFLTSAPVTSVAGKTGAVTLTVTDVSGAAPTASPALTGSPTAPTALTADNSTAIATTAFVKAQGYLTSSPVTSVAGRTGAVTLAVADVSGAAPLASPSLTGTPLSTTASADTNTTQIATTAFVVGQASSTSPVMDGSATVGTSLKYARADHIHPTDTSRAPIASPSFTGDVTSAGMLISNLSSGNEGGELQLAKPATGSTLAGTVSVDIYQNKIRFFENGGSNRGAYIDITAASASVGSNLLAGGSSGGCDVQTFGSSSTSGSFTWTKPAGAKWVEILLYGGGGGGGAGGRQATTSNRYGGGGGAGGSVFYSRINASYLGSTETVVIGSGGGGASGNTVDSTSSAAGTTGSATTFSLFTAVGGPQGSGGTAASGGAGAARSVAVFTQTTSAGGGGAGNIANGSSASNISAFNIVPSGGGGGGGAGALSTTSASGGAGGSFSASNSGLIANIAGGSGATVAGVAATAGTSATTQYMQGGTGGGGGAYRTGVVGLAGANGGWPGGGGGGGGASDNGFTSGAGGNGANGFAVIITYF